MNTHAIALQTGSQINGRTTTSVGMKALYIVSLALATAVCAQIHVPIDGTPVPITLQTLPVMLAPVLLGPWVSLMGIGLYLVLGMVGLPVYAEGQAGVAYMLSASGGYLLGFLLAQPAGAWVQRASGRIGRLPASVLSVVCCNVVIYACGLLWLKVYTNATWEQAIAMGLLPFVVVDLLKAGIASIVGGVFGRLVRD